RGHATPRPLRFLPAAAIRHSARPVPSPDRRYRSWGYPNFCNLALNQVAQRRQQQAAGRHVEFYACMILAAGFALARHRDVYHDPVVALFRLVSLGRLFESGEVVECIEKRDTALGFASAKVLTHCFPPRIGWGA